MVDRDTMVESVAATAAVLGFIAVMIAVGLAYGERGLTQTGAYALVGAIVVFVVVMSGVGVWLANRRASQRDGDENGDGNGTGDSDGTGA